MENERIIMAYLAGIMDGDGSFSIAKLANGSTNPLYFPVLQCATWRTEFLDALKSAFGGHLSVGKMHIRKDGTDGHALTHWVLRGSGNCKDALEKLMPFLKIKGERAQLLLDFIAQCPFIRGKSLTSQQLTLRESFYVKSIQYNDWKSVSGFVSSKLAKQNSEDKAVWSYIAGLMDTDGSFSVKKQVQNKGTDVKNPRYVPIISVSMTDTRAINLIRENCTVGKLYVPRNKATNQGFHYQFGIYSKKEAIVFLERIIPFLMAKKENAKLLLEFCMKSKSTGYCKAGIPKEELEYRDQCYRKLCDLNKYGVSKSSLIVLKPLPDNAGGNKEQAGQEPCSLNAVSEMTSTDDAVL